MVGGAVTGFNPMGAAMGGAIAGAVGAKLMGGTWGDVGKFALVGAATGFLGQGLANALVGTPMHAYRAAALTGLFSGLLAALSSPCL
jgi:hypothetical protein